jgi:hypothetical protein
MAASTIPRSSLIQTIEDVASHYVGELMAKAAGTAHLRRLRIEDETLSFEHVQAVMKSLQGSLKVLVGDQTAERAVAEVKRKLGLR